MRNLKIAILLAEDPRFYSHHGIDFFSILLALRDWWKIGRLVGASTLTQQLAKNLRNTPKRSVWNKFIEGVHALYLEWRYSKEEILKMYLNCAEWGAGVYGIEEAAQHYFQKTPDTLTGAEGAFLAAILKEPRYHEERFFAAAPLTLELRTRMARLLLWGHFLEQGELRHTVRLEESEDLEVAFEQIRQLSDTRVQTGYVRMTQLEFNSFVRRYCLASSQNVADIADRSQIAGSPGKPILSFKSAREVASSPC